eukprot:UN27263
MSDTSDLDNDGKFSKDEIQDFLVNALKRNTVMKAAQGDLRFWGCALYLSISVFLLCS